METIKEIEDQFYLVIVEFEGNTREAAIYANEEYGINAAFHEHQEAWYRAIARCKLVFGGEFIN